MATLPPLPPLPSSALDTSTPLPDYEDINFDATPTDNEEFLVDEATGETSTEENQEAAEIKAAPFNANLAEYMSDEDLEEIGCRVVEMVKTDIDSRKGWYEKLKLGMGRLGIYDPDRKSDAGITEVKHPLLLEAATQFQARAMAELLPPGGPVKTTEVGLQDDLIQAQATRVEKFMNYQLTLEDRTYYDERDQMFFLLPFTGSEFDKQYFDAATQKIVSRWVRCDDFIVPYDTKSLESASRYTHVIRKTGDQLRSLMASGFYRDCDLQPPSDTSNTDAPLTDKLTELDGQVKPDRLDTDKEYVLYETHIEFDIEGLEQPAPMPFIITVDSESEEVLGVYRNWRESDPLAIKRVWFSHKKFLPGFGFYGFGLLHCIGGLGEAASEILQILLDSGAYATLQGGFKSIDAKIKGDIVLSPGVWQDTEMTSEELSKAFYTPPWKEPSQVLNALLGTLTGVGEKFASTTETMTGDAATTGPVGTMVAQIEQGSKVFSGIHRRLHKAFGDEFLHIAELNGEHLPDSYPYKMADQEQHVLREDFNGAIDVIPVSDPNIFSNAQRIAMAQTALTLANQMPDIADRHEAAIQMMRAMRFPEPEKIFPKPSEAERADPVTEASLVLLGRPIKAYLDQDQQSHISVHDGQIPNMPKQYQPMMQAHLMEHMAMAQYLEFAKMGVPLPPIKWDAKKSERMMPDLPPQIEQQLSVMCAKAMQMMTDKLKNEQQQKEQQQAVAQAQGKEMARQQVLQMTQQGQPPQGQPQQPGNNPQQMMLEFQTEQQIKDAAFQKEQARKDAALAAEVDRKDAMAGIEPSLVKEAQQFLTQTGVQMSPRELAVLAKVFGTSFDKVVQALSRMQMQGQGGSQFQQTEQFMANNPARFQ